MESINDGSVTKVTMERARFIIRSSRNYERRRKSHSPINTTCVFPAPVKTNLFISAICELSRRRQSGSTTIQNVFDFLYLFSECKLRKYSNRGHFYIYEKSCLRLSVCLSGVSIFITHVISETAASIVVNFCIYEYIRNIM